MTWVPLAVVWELKRLGLLGSEWENEIEHRVFEAKLEIKQMADDARAAIDDILGWEPPF